MNFNTFTPRSLKSTIGALSAMALLGLCSILSSCHDNETNGNSSYEITASEIEELPTTDQLDVTFDGKAMVFGSDRTDFNGCLVNRMNNLTNETSSDAKAFIFTKGYSAGLTVQEAKTMLEAYENNATFVLVDPVKTDRSALVDTLQVAITEAADEGKSTTFSQRMLQMFSQYASSDQKIDGKAEAVAINRNGIYVVRNLEETANNQSKNSTLKQQTESGDTITLALAKQEYEPNGYDHGKSADMLVTWMTRCANAGKSLFSTGATTADGQLTAQMVTLQQFVGPTRALDRKILVEHNFEIYSLHSSKTDEDYYLVHLNSAFYNSQLGCTEQDKSGHDHTSYNWTKTNKVVTLEDGTVLDPSAFDLFDHGESACWYGPYFRGANCTLTIETDSDAEKENVKFQDALPTDALNSGATLTSGLNCIMTDIDFPDNSFWGGKNDETVTFNQSFSHQYDGLNCITEGHSGSEKTWNIVGQLARRIFIYRLKGSQKEVVITDIAHSIADYFQHNDFNEDFSIIFVVKNPKDNQSFNLHFTNSVFLDELYAATLYANPGIQIDAVTWLSEENTIPLTMPTRAVKHVIKCSDPTFLSTYEKAIKDYLKESKGSTWMGDYPKMSIYGSSKNEVDYNARHSLYEFSRLVYVVANRYNIKGTMTFELRSESSNTLIGSFKLSDGIVSY